jgi:hypothetical protein
MKQRKLAISLGIVGAIAAPFILGTSKMRPTWETWVPMTAEENASIAEYLKETNNCQVLSDRVARLVARLRELNADAAQITDALLRNSDSLEETDCHLKLDKLNKGGQFETRFDPVRYLAFNAASVAGGFGIIYGLTFLLPALARRYWDWLNM